MCVSLRAWGCAVSVFVLAWGALPETISAQVKKTAQVERGQKLFERVWEPGHDAEAGGDGLGPLFNARSCAACHVQGGIGGAGPAEANVLLLSAAIPKDPAGLVGLGARLTKLHPAFASATTIVLHRFSSDPVPYTACFAIECREILRHQSRLDAADGRNAGAPSGVENAAAVGPARFGPLSARRPR